MPEVRIQLSHQPGYDSGLKEKIMIVYKLTDVKHQTYNRLQWGENITNRVEIPSRTKLCSKDLIHYYHDPLVAMFVNPIHGDYQPAVLWEAQTDCDRAGDGLKFGSWELTTKHILPIPQISTEQRVRFALYIVLHTYDNPAYTKWAWGWLKGEDRSEAAARTARAAWAAWAAAWAAEQLITSAAHWAIKDN